MTRQSVDVQTAFEERIDVGAALAFASRELDRTVSLIATILNFGEVVDWRCEMPSMSLDQPHDIGAGIIHMTMSENDQALRSGNYIRFSILPAEGSMHMQGGYYDAFHQPAVLCESCVPLDNMTSQELDSNLNSMYQVLMQHYRTLVAPCMVHKTR